MKGKVKWFSRDKGFGFITDEDGKDYFFDVQSIKGSELPDHGDIVEFEYQEGKKGPRATHVVILDKSEHSQKRDDRVTCPHCGKKMVPRLITYQGSVQKSVCPFCGETFKDFSKCFIATAVYGSPYATEVIVLRKFRDNYLLSSVTGRFLVKVYYLISPKIVKIIQKSNNTRIILKKVLDYIVKHVTTAYR